MSSASGLLAGWGLTVRTGCVGDLDGCDVMLCLVCVRRSVWLLVGHPRCGVVLCACVPLSKICVYEPRQPRTGEVTITVLYDATT